LRILIIAFPEILCAPLLWSRGGARDPYFGRVEVAFCQLLWSRKICRFRENELETGGGPDSQDIKTSNRKKKEANRTVMLKFQTELKSLLAAMDGTRTRYIRCIKANAAMVPKWTKHPSTMMQLECSGLMTALIISLESYPQKLGYKFIMK
jgi:myosin heavy subunit